jgi:hypothetical protein
MAFDELGSQGVFTGATPITLIAVPGASTRRIVRQISVRNADTVERTITLRKTKGASSFIICSYLLNPGDTYYHTDTIVLADTDESITGLTDNTATTTEPSYVTTYGDET